MEWKAANKVEWEGRTKMKGKELEVGDKLNRRGSDERNGREVTNEIEEWNRKRSKELNELAGKEGK